MRPVVLGCVLAVSACGGDAEAPDTDTTPATSVCPVCSGMRDECVPVGTCTYDGAAFGAAGSTDCWSNGVVQAHDPAETVVTLDGELCHTWETRLLTTTFYAADGSVAGTMRFDLATRSVTIECDGESWTVGPEDECPSWFPEGVDCQPGTCPEE